MAAMRQAFHEITVPTRGKGLYAGRVGQLWHTPDIPSASPALLPFELLIGLRYTHAKRRNHFISFISIVAMAGIALGVMALIVVLSVMNGFQEELRTRILGVAAHLEISGPADRQADLLRVAGMV